MHRLILTVVMLASFALPVQGQQDWKRVDEAMGRAGTDQPNNVRRYSFPRSDLKVTVDGVEIKPALALGTWLAFQPMGNQTMVMGDLVLSETEINPVMSKLVENGIAITAIHHHILRAQPMTLYMHVEGHGDPAKLASGVRQALAMSKTPTGAPAGSPPAQESVDPAIAKLEQALGHKGKMSGGVYQVSVPRRGEIKMGDMAVPASMGLGIAMNFQPTGNGKVATTGDFVLTESEIQPVIQALRQNDIEVTSLHNHMLTEEPRLFFMHFWANAEAEKVGSGLKAALQKIDVKRE